MSIDTKIGDKIKGLLCEDCEKKIKEMTAKLGTMSLLFPERSAKKFANALCKNCKEDVKKRLGVRK